MSAAEAPTGNVALVFTDVQGSSAIWDAAPDAMRAALEVHDQVLRGKIEEHEGYEVKTEGDAFMVAFPTPSAAARWCLDTQRALVEAAWPEGLGEHGPAAAEDDPGGRPLQRGLRVRMGIHRGEPDCRPDPVTGRMDYFGPMVNRAARVAAAGHGGQVLVSAAVHEDLRDAPVLAEAVVQDLGRHGLKGLSRPETLFQLLPKALAARRFPPPRTETVQVGNLSAEGNRFFGREHERQDLTRLVREGARLVSLIGPGGTGKTRLSHRVALDLQADFAERGGAWFCELAGDRRLGQLLETVARVLGVQLRGDDEAASLDQLGEALAQRGPTLLVLDNCEQVVGPAARTARAWLRAAPELHMVTTSREALGLDAEVRVEVLPFGEEEGAALFLDRMRTARAKGGSLPPGGGDDAVDPEVIAKIVRSLDGIPLAIELAAARCRVLAPAAVLERLTDRFQLLRSRNRDRDARQATLQGAIDWSWDLLSSEERAALARLSAFRGGFLVEAALDVLHRLDPAGREDPLDLVEALREKSLLRVVEESAGTLRLGMYETIRDYASDRLTERGEREATHHAHALHFADQAQRWGFPYDEWPPAEVIDEMDRERANLNAAYLRMRFRDPEVAARVLLGASPLLKNRGPMPLLWDRADELLEGELPIEDLAVRCQLLEARAHGRSGRGDRNGSVWDARDAVEVARETGETQLVVQALTTLAFAHLRADEVDAAGPFLDEAADLARDLGPRTRSAALSFQALAAGQQGRVGEQLRLLEQAREMVARSPDRSHAGYVNCNYAEALLNSGRLHEARAPLKLAHEVAEEYQDRFLDAMVHQLDACRLALKGEPGKGLGCVEAAVSLQRLAGTRAHRAASLRTMALVQLMNGDPAGAEQTAEEARALLHEFGLDAFEGLARAYLAAARAIQGDLPGAEDQLMEAKVKLVEGAHAWQLQSAYVAEGLVDLARARAALEARRGEGAREAFDLAKARLEISDGSPEEASEPDRFVHVDEGPLELRLVRRVLAAEVDELAAAVASVAG